MDPEVRYCTTADGVRIAYTVTGSGPHFVSLIDPIVSHVSLEWTPFARTLEEEARHFTLVRLDLRGTGLSERVLPTSPEDATRDVLAVVDRLHLDRFTLHANTTVTPHAIMLAARHPHRVARLILVDGYARSEDFSIQPQLAALAAAAASDWETATESVGAIAFGPGREESRRHGEYIRACVTPEYFTATANFPPIDVTELAATLPMPVLVVRHLGLRAITDDMTQRLVASIPDARLVTVNGTWADDPEGLVRRMAAFVDDRAARPPEPMREQSGVRTLLFTDLVDHTEMMRRLGDGAGRELLREHERITRDAIRAHGGNEIKTDGDSFMVSFGSITSAICAVALQRAFEQRNETSPEPLRVRMGLNAGEPVEDAGDLFGEAVILASRIAAQAGPGEILIPEPVRHLLAGKGFLFADRGEFVPKGFEDAVRLYDVRWRE